MKEIVPEYTREKETVKNNNTKLLEAVVPYADKEAYERLRQRAARSVYLKTLALLLKSKQSDPDQQTLTDLQILHELDSGSNLLLNPSLIHFLDACFRHKPDTGAFADSFERLRSTLKTLSEKRSLLPLRKVDTDFAYLDSEWTWGQTASYSEMVTGTNYQISKDTSGGDSCAVNAISFERPPRSLLEGAELIKHRCADLWSGMQRVVSSICPIQSESVVGFSIQTLPGIIFVNVNSEDPLWFAERLVHEFAHSKLFLINICETLVKNNGATQFVSPWRKDKRHAWGILNGAFVHWHVIALFMRLPPEVCDIHELNGRIETERNNIRSALSILRNCNSLSDFGNHLLVSMERAFAD